MRCGIHGRHMPGACFSAHTAADALVSINALDAGFIGINRAHRTSFTAGGLFALAAGIGEVSPAVFRIQTCAVAAGEQVARYLNAGDVTGAAAIVRKRAVDLAALAANAAVRVYYKQTLRECPYAYFVLGYSLLGDTQHAEQRSGQCQASQAFSGQLQELPAGVVLENTQWSCWPGGSHRTRSAVVPFR